MSVRDRLIQLTLRARNFLSSDVAPATESMRELTEEGRRLKASMEDVGRARGLARTLRDNQQATEGLARSQADARATLDDLTREIGDNATATAGQRIALREARRTLEEAERAYKRNQQAIKNTASELKKLGVDTDNVVAEEKRLTSELEDGKQALAANREAIREKRVEEKKAADTAKEHAERVDAAKGAMADAGRKVLAFAAAYVSLNAAMGLVQRGLSLVAQGIRAVAMDGADKQGALAQLEATLASTGRQAEFTTQRLLDMADAMEAGSMLTAEQVQAAQARLLSYTDVAANEFPRALQIAIDQQQRLGISAEASAEIVGRALQSPSKAMAALSRQGFTLEAGQQRLLKQLEATGRMAEAQSIIMDMLTEAYGGSAAAARMNTFQGLLKGISDRFGDFASRVGNSGAFDFMQRKLLELSDYLDQMANDGRLDQLAEALSTAFIDAAERAEEFAKKLLDIDFSTLTSDASRWLDDFGEKLDTAGRWINMITAPFRVLLNVVTGGISAIGVAFTGLISASLAGMALLARAIPDAFGGQKIVAGLESARDTALSMMSMLAGQVAQDGRDIADTWNSVAEAAEGSADRQAKAAAKAAEDTRKSMQKTGDDIASFFRSNITTLEQALAAISFAETAEDLVEIEKALADSKLTTEELGTAMEALGQKTGFVTVADGAKRTTTELEQLRKEQARLKAEYDAGNITLQQWQDGHNAAAEAIRKLGGENEKAATTAKGLGRELKTLADVQRAISDAKTDRDISVINAALKRMLDTGIIDGAQYNAEMQKSAARLKEIKASLEGAKKAQEDKNKSDQQAIVTSEQLRRESGKRMEAERKAGDEAMQRRRKESSDAQRDMSAMEDFFGGVVSRAREPLAALSAAALKAFDRLRGISSIDISMDTSGIEATTKSLERAREELGKLQLQASSVGMSGLGRWMTQMQVQSQQVQVRFLEQKQALQDLVEGYEAGRISADAFAAAGRTAQNNLDLLDSADLSQLESAIASAEQRMQQLGESSRNTLASLQDELDKVRGNEDAIERRRAAQRRRELEQQLDEARQGGDSQAVANLQQSLSLLRQIEAETAQQREQQANQQRAAQQQAAPAASAQQAEPTKVIRLETARGRRVDVSVPAGGEDALLGILEEAGLRSL